MILGGDITSPLRRCQISGVLYGITQRVTELDRTGLRPCFQGGRNGVGYQQAGIPEVATKGVDGALAIFVFVEFLRSEEHTSELQSRGHLVCRLLLEKKREVRARSARSTTGQRSPAAIPRWQPH